EAKNYFSKNEYKDELIEEIASKGEKITFYTCGKFIDLCRGGHLDNPKEEIAEGSFKLDRVAGAYWRGDEKNKMLTRIYGLAFETKEQLEEYINMREEAKKRDHKKLGRDLDLFMFSETVGKGLPLFTHKGATIRRELERFIVDEEIKRGYLHVITPDIAKLDLYKKSGHYPHYKDSMYAPIKIDEDEFMLRPMTCPHHFELYLGKPHSYRDLPMRIGELAKLYRYEQSGELMGLIRLRTFCLADAHIICASEQQAMEEIAGALDLIEYITSVFGLKLDVDYRYRLSLGDIENTDKYYKNDEAWVKGEELLRELMKNRKSEFEEAKGEAAFYGPKIDIQMKNVSGKEDTAFTVQYDFCMPERFDLAYTGEDGKSHRAFVVHRSSIGCIERLMAFLIEKYAGAFPTWLSPIQVAIVPVRENHEEEAKKISDILKSSGIRVETYSADRNSLGKRIHEAKSMKTPYVIVLGDKEVESGKLTIENRDGTKTENTSSEEFISNLKKEIEAKS
ncbi:MAG: threonine--tRNA ligase, partial [archaeon]